MLGFCVFGGRRRGLVWCGVVSGVRGFVSRWRTMKVGFCGEGD